MIIPSDEPTIVDSESWERRIGKSNYWIQVTAEDLKLAPTWRMNIVQKAPRSSKSKPPIHLIGFSPQNPLFTAEFDGQRYPLMIGKIASSRGGKIIVGGSRKIGYPHSSMLTWVADFACFEKDGTTYIRIDSRFRCPKLKVKSASVGIKIPLLVYQPTFLDSPVPNTKDVSVSAVWVERAETAIALAVRGENCSGIGSFSTSLMTTINEIDTRGRIPVNVTIALRTATGPNDALHLVRAEVAGAIEPSPPTITGTDLPLLSAAREGIRQLSDSKNCESVGKERWYFRVSEKFDYGPGYPFFSSEASPAILRWNKFYKDEIAERAAKMTARGLAADFAVIVGESGAEGNKGAFWDNATGPSETLTFSNVDGKKEYGIASNARISLALFQMFADYPDPIYRQAAMNNCHWLILKQNAAGYYDGPFVSAQSGQFTENVINFDGVMAMRPLIAAFRTTGNEVFVKNAWKIAEYIKSTLIPNGTAPCLYGFPPQENCPLALTGVVHGLLDLDAEAPNEGLRRLLSIAADWLAVCEFDASIHRCLNYDGAYSGSLECALCALRLFTFYGRVRWFGLAYALIKQVVNQGEVNWRLGDCSLQLLLSLGSFLPGGSTDLSAMTVTIEWTKYAPDTAASEYYEVWNERREPVDFLPLVCRETNQTLILVLPARTDETLLLIKRNRTGNQRAPIVDAVTGEHCTLELPIHPLPAGLGRFSAVRVDP